MTDASALYGKAAAPVHPASGRGVGDDWDIFASPSSPTDFVQAWFRILCRETGGARRAVLLLRTAEGAFAPVARWPEDKTEAASEAEAEASGNAGAEPVSDPLGPACEAAHASGTMALRSGGAGQRAVGFPVVVGGNVEAIIGMIVPEPQLRPILRRLQWGAGWLYGIIAERQSRNDRDTSADTSAALRVLAAMEDGETLEASLRAFVNEVQALIRAERVSVALVHGGRLRLRALSQTAEPETRSAGARSLVQAMEEGRVQIQPLTWPAPEPTGVAVLAAHAAHAARSGALGIVTLPLTVAGRIIGMVSAERMQPDPGGGRFSAPEQARLEAIAGLCAPMLHLRMRENRIWSGRGRLWLGRAVAAVFGRRSPGIRMAAGLLAVSAVILGTVQTGMRITAEAELRGDMQRVAVAPFDGFIAAAAVRAGDTVRAGDVLAVLDDTDLRLDLLRWESERARLEQEKSTALAAGDRARIAALDAQIARVAADAELARSRLDRVRIRAPFDGLVISGDLSQRLGAPVRQGDDLFQVASGQDLRLDLRVGEYDIGLVEAGATGRLALSGISGAEIAFEVTRIAELASAGAGGTVFRAEARLIDPPPGLRPGLDGVAKVDAGRAPLFHALFRPVTTRLRILLWKWMP
ncbi:MAG: HlyD family efflux transporter periplasmic adaptor subunit [Pseudorhodobacter sp.]